jgi:hypothetical protein
MNNGEQFFNTSAAGGYAISRSLRFNSSDSAYLSRTPASAGNRKTWTWAGWVKRVNFGAVSIIYSAIQGGNDGTVFYFDVSNQLNFFNYVGGSYAGRRITTPVYRDPSGWYHIVLIWDSANATTDNRIRLYVNGIEVTTFGTNTDPSSADSFVNSTNSHYIGADVGFNNFYSNLYLADIHFIDGQALDPTSFGEFDDNGIWQPKAYTGTYGTNGFHLDFSDNSAATATTLGKDRAGSNNWTPNNLSVTAGAGNDSLVDVPTTTGTDTGVGGEVRGNYCTWNPLSGGTLANGNLDVSGSSAVRGTIGVTTGKWYYEFTLSTNVGSSPNLNVGVIRSNATSSSFTYDLGNSLGASSGDVIGVALDVDAGKLWIAKNGTWVGSGNPGTGANATISSITLSGDSLTFYNGPFNSVSYSANFGQRAFAYTNNRSGFKALNTANLPAPLVTKPSTVFDVKLYTGNGSTQTISGLEFSPDLVWIKARSTSAYNHFLLDTVRGVNNELNSNTTDFEFTRPAPGSLTAFNSDGFALNTAIGVNASSTTYAAWTWDAGTTTATNDVGSISSQVRTNNYLSIVTWTGNASNATIGHGLGVAPSLILLKFRGSTSNWSVYHSSLGNTKRLILNSTAAEATGSTFWNNTSPTSTVFSVGTDLNDSTTIVAYCFAPVAGYSSFGSYVGNGSASDGPFVYTGFRPRWLMVKRATGTSGGSDWLVYDALRPGNNLNDLFLKPNTSDSEQSGSTNNPIDLLSNGFKIRWSTANSNASGETFIFAAFAESPFQYARAR